MAKDFISTGTERTERALAAARQLRDSTGLANTRDACQRIIDILSGADAVDDQLRALDADHVGTARGSRAG